MAKSAVPSTRSVVRGILTAHPTLSNDEVVTRAIAGGAKGTRDAVMKAVYNLKAEIRKAGPSSAAKSGPVKVPTAPSVQAIASTPASDLAGALANVAEVHAVVLACSGEAQAKRAAEAVRACGGVDAFLAVLDLVAGIRGAK